MNPAASVKNQDCSIIALDKFIQATRDSGYKGTASAISELVDNSIQAGATRIAISVTANAVDDEEKRYRGLCARQRLRHGPVHAAPSAPVRRQHPVRRSVAGSAATAWAFRMHR